MSGWKNMIYPRRLLLLAMLMTPFSNLVAETDTSPSMELLEFLGEWETEEGEWIAPDELESDYFDELLSADEIRKEDE